MKKVAEALGVSADALLWINGGEWNETILPILCVLL